MDVYGYPPYPPYNQSDELAKQTFAQQAISTSIPYPNRGMPEPHVMPAPTGAPWNVQGVSWGMTAPPELVQFTAAGRQSLEERELRIMPAIHCKRKSLDVEPVIPAKQRITEEKMAAHLNGLHISSEYTSHSLANNDTMDVSMEPFASTSTTTAEKLKGHTIVLSDEIKKLQEEPLLPAALIERSLAQTNVTFSQSWFEKPRMSALVVWKPREHIIGAPQVDEKKSKDKEEEPQRRNGVLVSSQPSQAVEDVEM